MEKFKVTFFPENKTIEVPKDTTILSAAISAGIYINSNCGGEGVCGRCKVILKEGRVVTQSTGILAEKEKAQNIYLACLATVHSDLKVEVPVQSRLDFSNLSKEELDVRLKNFYVKTEEVEVSLKAPTEHTFTNRTFTEKRYLELPVPTLNDNVGDLERLLRQIKQDNVHMGLSGIKQLGELLRDSNWKVTVTLANSDKITEAINVEPGDTSRKNFGLCFDIGTTTVSAQLINLVNSKIISTKATYNRQATFGSDVISRIIYAQEIGGLDKLHKIVIDTLNQIIKEFIDEHKIDLNDVTCIFCTGNTTMIHLLLNIDPANIRKDPYIPTANQLPIIRASEVGLYINPHGLLYCVPGVSSYVGADTTSGILASGLYKEKELSMLIDIGTNGEIALGNKDFLVACAASAGPAFEGSGVMCGMRAGKGAIEKIKINPKDLRVTYNTIGAIKPRGICGSGYLDLLAEMLRVSLIDKNGKIKPVKHERIREGELGCEFVVVFKDETDIASDIVITEADIENLKRAKAAIYSASAILVKHLDFDFTKIKKFFIAGGFGSYINIDSAIAIGLLPDIERKRFIFIGNSALSGTREMILSLDAVREGKNIAKKTTYLELSVEPKYMDEYMAALFFPHTDLSKFPSLMNRN